MGDEVGEAIKRYEQNKRAMIRELTRYIAAHQPTDTDTRSIADAINRACRHFGYNSGANASMVAKRALTQHEKKHLVPTEVKAGYFACAFALYGEAPWAKTPEAAQYQVYSYCLFGTPTPPPGADTSRLDALPKTIHLERIRPQQPEPIEQREAIAAQLRAATLPAVADYLEALVENIRAQVAQPVDVDDEDEEPCDEQNPVCIFLTAKLSLPSPLTPSAVRMVASSAGMTVERARAVLCGAEPTDEESGILAQLSGVSLEQFNLMANYYRAAKAAAASSPELDVPSIRDK